MKTTPIFKIPQLKSLNLKDSRFKIVQEGQPNGSNFFGRREKTSRRGMTVYIHFSPKQKKKPETKSPCLKQWPSMRPASRTPGSLNEPIRVHLTLPQYGTMFGKFQMLTLLPVGVSLAKSFVVSLSSAPADNTARLSNKIQWNFKRIFFGFSKLNDTINRIINIFRRKRRVTTCMSYCWKKGK